MVNGNKRHWSGVRCDQVSRQMEAIVFFEEGIERTAWHARQGHKVVLVTGMPEPIARMAARAMECELEARGVVGKLLLCATRMEEREGKVDGALAWRSGVRRRKVPRGEAHCARTPDRSANLARVWECVAGPADACGRRSRPCCESGKRLGGRGQPAELGDLALARGEVHGSGDAAGRDNDATWGELGMNLKKTERTEPTAVAATWRGAGGATQGEVFLGGAQSVLSLAREWVRREAEVAWAGSGAYERVALSYLGVSSALIAYFAKNLQHPLKLLGVQAGVALMVMVLCWVGARAAAKEARFGMSFGTRLVAFLAALVSASVLPFLFRRTGVPDDAGHAAMARRQDYWRSITG